MVELLESGWKPWDVGMLDRIRGWLRLGTWNTALGRGVNSHLDFLCVCVVVSFYVYIMYSMGTSQGWMGERGRREQTYVLMTITNEEIRIES